MVEEKGPRLRRGFVYSLTEDQSSIRPVDVYPPMCNCDNIEITGYLKATLSVWGEPFIVYFSTVHFKRYGFLFPHPLSIFP